MTDILTDETNSTARLWQEFVRYMTRHSADQPCLGVVHILMRGNRPIAWKLSLSPTADFPVPPAGDTDKQWAAFVRHLLYACGNNRGYGILRATVTIAGRRPYFWVEAQMSRIHPVEVVDDSADEVVRNILFPGYLRADTIMSI